MKNKTEYFVFIKKYEVILISGITIFAVCILSLMFLKPNFDRANKIYRDLEIMKSRLKKLQVKDDALSSVNYQLYRDSFTKIDRVLPAGKEYVSLFSTFDEMEKNYGITITKTDFQLGVVSTNSSQLVRDTGSSAYVVPMSLGVIGTKDAIQKFIRSLGNFSGRFITVDSISWEITKDGSYDLVINGKAYFYPLPTSLGNIDVPIPEISAGQDKILSDISNIDLSGDDNQAVDTSEIGKKDLFQ